MDRRYQTNCEGIDWAEVHALFEAAGLGGRAGDKIRRSYETSSLVCLVFAGQQLIALSRAITDWGYHAVICAVAVDPGWQRQGTGSKMLRFLLDRLPVWRVMLVSDDENARRFYRRPGFETYANVLARLDWNRLYDPPPA